MSSAPSRRMVHEGLFTDDSDGEGPALLGGRCRACELHHFPRGVTCPYCGSEDTEDATLSRRGRLWAHTAVTAPPPGYRGEVPYGFGVVELPEGIRIVARLTESDPAQLQQGDAMELVVVPLHSDDEGVVVTTFAFSATATS
ncbi:MAG: Zn-ribbon domain-containing OB-fold protein [Acidimicrobiales bacterium]